MVGALILACRLGLAHAGEAPAPAPAPASEPQPTDPAASQATPAELLAAAREAYLLGDHDGASSTLRALVRDHDAGLPVGREVWAESLVFLGEIQYVDGDRIAAESTFRLLLEREPTWRISPYDHPMDVVGVFEVVRAAVRSEAERTATVTPEPPPRLPWWTFAPFGAPQLGRDRVAPGAALAVAQVGLAGASIGSWVWIDRLRQPRADGESAEAGQARLERAALVRDAFNIPVSAAFYAVWAGSVLEAARWHRRHAPDAPATGEARVQLEVGPDGVRVGVAGRW
jgi:hypothetical protein